MRSCASHAKVNFPINTNRKAAGSQACVKNQLFTNSSRTPRRIISSGACPPFCPPAPPHSSMHMVILSFNIARKERSQPDMINVSRRRYKCKHDLHRSCVVTSRLLLLLLLFEVSYADSRENTKEFPMKY